MQDGRYFKLDANERKFRRNNQLQNANGYFQPLKLIEFLYLSIALMSSDKQIFAFKNFK